MLSLETFLLAVKQVLNIILTEYDKEKTVVNYSLTAKNSSSHSNLNYVQPLSLKYVTSLKKKKTSQKSTIL